MNRATDLAYVRYQVTDLVRMEAFLTDFGMVPALPCDGSRLLMRGSGDAPYIYEAVLGDTCRFLGAGLRVASHEDLARLSALPGSSAIEPVGEVPDGGERVRMRMPDGFEIDALHGGAAHGRPSEAADLGFNSARHKARRNQAVRVAREAWVDHHCMPVLGTPEPGVHHCSFEMDGLDAVMCAHDFLMERGYTLDCGVGRHLLGSQIFDYWRDPFGFRIEHYTDGDVVNHAHQPSVFAGTADETTQWCAKPPKDFFE
ncbi:hypothetical protein [Burkholderia sp. 22PA0106]|uniref:hypothetical protein n=1 Tax=Burkholderia sp. 22PA0106 TaxID=3237371 RepID=UPI0039C39BE7